METEIVRKKGITHKGFEKRYSRGVMKRQTGQQGGGRQIKSDKIDNKMSQRERRR